LKKGAVSLHSDPTRSAQNLDYHKSTSRVLKIASIATIEDICPLTLTSIKLSQSGGFILKEGLMQASL